MATEGEKLKERQILTHKPAPNDNQPGERPPVNRCPPTEIDPCDPLAPVAMPPLPVEFRTLVESLEPRWKLGDDDKWAIGCNRITTATIFVGADVHIEQTWNLQKIARGEISAVMPLAPGEQLSFRVTRSQRTSMDRTTMNSKESIRNSESTTSDKEVMEATRAITRNQGWSVSATAGVQAGPVRASATVGYHDSVQSAVNNKLQQIQEATQKASNQLRHLNKVEVTESSQTQVVDERVRKITNPYRDRALTLYFWDLIKYYCVDLHLQRVNPVLVFDVPSFVFDREFILQNGAFVTGALLDRGLANELQTALQSAQLPSDLDDTSRVEGLSQLALEHLFISFNLIAADRPFEYTDPRRSFIAGSVPGSPTGAASDSGFKEALGKDSVQDIFLLLNSFYRILEDRGVFGDPPTAAGLIQITARDAALALSKELKPLWANVSKDDKKNVFQRDHQTAVFRRIPGFLAVVDQLVRPLMDGDSQRQGYERAGLVIGRVIAHMSCFADFYTERLHEYLFAVTRGSAHRAAVLDAIEHWFGLTDAERLDFVSNFRLDKIYLDGSRILVPFGGDDPYAILERHFPDDDFGKSAKLEPFEIALPADGAHVESVAGECVLPDVPDPLPTDDDA